MSLKEKTQYGIYGSSYPDIPVVELPHWKQHYNRRPAPNKLNSANPSEKVKNLGPKSSRKVEEMTPDEFPSLGGGGKAPKAKGRRAGGKGTGDGMYL